VGLLAAVAITLLTVEMLLRALVIPIANTSPHRAYLLYTAQSSDVVIGDSHVYRDFLGSDRFVNLGRGGATVGEMKAIARAFYARHSPGRAIVQASPHLFSQPTSRELLDKQFTSMIRSPVLIAAFEPAIAMHLGRVWDLGRLRREREEAETHRTLVGRWHLIRAAERRRRTRRRVDLQRPNWNAQARLTLRAYDEMLSYLTDRGVTVCMLRPPVSREYIEMTEDDPDYLEAERVFADLAARHEIRFVDFRDLGLDLPSSAFLNQDHITPATSGVFVRAVESACFGDRRSAAPGGLKS
jgi:hypothetical protein